jgi:hypothetical protein
MGLETDGINLKQVDNIVDATIFLKKGEGIIQDVSICEIQHDKIR